MSTIRQMFQEIWKSDRTEMERFRRCQHWAEMQGFRMGWRMAPRLALHKELKDKAYDGKVALSIWSRDCDCVETTRLAYIPATPQAYDNYVARECADAEGPVSVRILTLEEAAEFEPMTRDRILEAFEEGHSWRI